LCVRRRTYAEQINHLRHKWFFFFFNKSHDTLASPLFRNRSGTIVRGRKMFLSSLRKFFWMHYAFSFNENSDLNCFFFLVSQYVDYIDRFGISFVECFIADFSCHYVQRDSACTLLYCSSFSTSSFSVEASIILCLVSVLKRKKLEHKK